MNDHFEQLLKYIRQHLAWGFHEPHIRQVLQQHGWHDNMVNQAFEIIHRTDQQQPAAIPRLSQTPDQSAPRQAAHTGQQHESAGQTQRQPAAGEPARRRYRVYQAVADAARAIRVNPAAFAVAVLVVAVCAWASMAILMLILAPLVLTGNLVLILIVVYVLSLIWYALAGALFVALPAVVVHAGAQGRRIRPGTALSQGFSRFLRVALADALFGLILYLPVVGMFTVALAALSAEALAGVSHALFPFLMLGALIWILIAFVRYAMVPYVALFEPEVPLMRSFARSQHLLKGGGQWFLVKGSLLYLTILVLVGAATGSTVRDLEASGDGLASLLLIPLLVFSNCVMVMLYLNRRAARG